MRYTSPLQDSGFQYGINLNLLKKAVSHWRHQFDWKKQVAVLNKYPNFKTSLEGNRSPMVKQFDGLQKYPLEWETFTNNNSHRIGHSLHPRAATTA